VWVEQYIQYLRYEKNYSSHTVFAYKRDLEQFLAFASDTFQLKHPSDIDADIIRAWMLALMEKGDTARSVNRRLSSLRSYWRYLLRRGLVTANPTQKVLTPKIKKNLPSFLKEDELNDLLDKVREEGQTDSFIETRDSLILEMFCLTGIRRAELIGLKTGDLDMGSASLKVTGKRNKQRILPFGSALKKSIEHYLALRRDYLDKLEDYPEEEPPFFINDKGQALSPRRVYSLVNKKLAEVGNLSKRSPHVLRHTFATTLLNRGAELNAVKELLGHASLSATEVYTHTTFEELKKVYKLAHPRAEIEKGD